jgi:hypothetical protein
VALALAGRKEPAEAAAEEAERLASRLHYPVGQAAKAEAAGACAESANEMRTELEEAREKWAELGRPLDAARCLLVWGRVLEGRDDAQAAELFERAASEYEQLGVAGMAEGARERVG